MLATTIATTTANCPRALHLLQLRVLLLHPGELLLLLLELSAHLVLALLHRFLLLLHQPLRLQMLLLFLCAQEGGQREQAVSRQSAFRQEATQGGPLTPT